jgi:hypothetical protein
MEMAGEWMSGLLRAGQGANTEIVHWIIDGIPEYLGELG